MAFLRRDSETTAAAPSGRATGDDAKAHGVTVIAQGTRVSGEIGGGGELQVDGEVEGEVKLPTSTVTVGSDGQVVGDIAARVVRVAGRVAGNVSGGEKVEILASGRLEGDVRAPRVVLAEGAFFKGNVEMVKDGMHSPSGGQKGET